MKFQYTIVIQLNAILSLLRISKENNQYWYLGSCVELEQKCLVLTKKHWNGSKYYILQQYLIS